MMGRIITPEARQKLSAGRLEAFRTGRLKLSPRAGCGRGGFYPDIGHYVRSSYEYTFARWLQQNLIPYEYEARRFELVVRGKPTGLTPDFLIDGHWVEIKNSYNQNDLVFIEKLAAFRATYPREHLVVILGTSRMSDINVVMEHQKDLVEITHTLRAVLCVKG
jgi:hypothetical protein